MGSAIVAGIASRISDARIRVYDIDSARIDVLTERYGLFRSTSPEKLVQESEIIILAVKPNLVLDVLGSLRPHLAGKVLVSVAGGITIAQMASVAGPSVHIIRVMPNTPALISEGTSVLSAGDTVPSDTLDLVRGLFELLGTAIILPEKMMDAVTGLSGSGPAYVFTFIQALADGGVKMGIPRREAMLLAAGTVQGAARMALQSGDNPIELRNRVASPGGTTIEGIHVLERSGFSGIVMDAVQAAAEKSRKLGGG